MIIGMGRVDSPHHLSFLQLQLANLINQISGHASAKVIFHQNICICNVLLLEEKGGLLVYRLFLWFGGAFPKAQIIQCHWWFYHLKLCFQNCASPLCSIFKRSVCFCFRFRLLLIWQKIYFSAFFCNDLINCVYDKTDWYLQANR